MKESYDLTINSGSKMNMKKLNIYFAYLKTLSSILKEKVSNVSFLNINQSFDKILLEVLFYNKLKKHLLYRFYELIKQYFTEIHILLHHYKDAYCL